MEQQDCFLKPELSKEDLRKAFEQGERFDYRPSLYKCFNRWYNENYIDSSKCNDCEFKEAKKYRTCKTCVEFSNFKEK